MSTPISILDLGGTEDFWEKMGFAGDSRYEILLLNLEEPTVHHSNLLSVAGNACDMPEYGTDSFDVVFSNSVIEHVGAFEDQARTASEVMRVGKRYYVQTPNRFFPIEPHFLGPGFQFLPRWLKVAMIHRFALGWYDRAKTREEACRLADEIRLMRRGELERLFPGGAIMEEKFYGLVKSFSVYAGFGRSEDRSGNRASRN